MTQMLDKPYMTKDVNLEYEVKSDNRKNKTKLEELRAIMDRWSKMEERDA